MRDVIHMVKSHRRHVELSPGVGGKEQAYALAVCDDILADLESAALSVSPPPSEPEQSVIDTETGMVYAVRGRRLNGVDLSLAQRVETIRWVSDELFARIFKSVPAPPSEPPDVERLRVLAETAACQAHYSRMGYYAPHDRDGHEHGFGTCPHPDCLLVRTAQELT